MVLLQQLLADAFGVESAAETTALYERIHAGDFRRDIDYWLIWEKRGWKASSRRCWIACERLINQDTRAEISLLFECFRVFRGNLPGPA